MVKYLLLIVLLLGYGLKNSAPVFAEQMANYCQMVINDDLRALKQEIRKSRLTNKLIGTAIECSSDIQFPGGNLLRLAIASGAIEVAIYLINSTSAKQLREVDKDGKTLMQWAKHHYQDDAGAEAIMAHLKTKIE